MPPFGLNKAPPRIEGMDYWKLARLLAYIAAILLFVAAGTYARLRWGVPEAPYGWTEIPNTQRSVTKFESIYLGPFYMGQGVAGVSTTTLWTPRTNNPFREIQITSGAMEVYDFRDSLITSNRKSETGKEI